MPKKITVTLSDKSHKFFNEVMYSLDLGDGKPGTQANAINWCLEAISDFEDTIGEDLVGWLAYYKANKPADGV